MTRTGDSHFLKRQSPFLSRNTQVTATAEGRCHPYPYTNVRMIGIAFRSSHTVTVTTATNK